LDKPLLIVAGAIRTPPFSTTARLEAGFLLRFLQQGESLSLPQSRPMPSIGSGCHELRIRDADHNWRIFYLVSPQHIVILDVLDKKTQTTPDSVLELCRARASAYLAALKEEKE